VREDEAGAGAGGASPARSFGGQGGNAEGGASGGNGASSGEPSSDAGQGGALGVEAGAGGAGGAATPACSGGACNQPSCRDLPETCGPTGDDSCCASSLVPGGTHYRNYDNFQLLDHPATVSDFRLDTYEVTVGRFRQFVAAYSKAMFVAGGGKNPNDPSDTGWDVSYNGLMPGTSASLANALVFTGSPTWSGGDDNLPINSITWYEASAFCIWDGGRLPTEAEWSYAAAGGSEQRVFPWGTGPVPADTSDTTALQDYAVYGNAPLAPVGTHGMGNGKWGQADLAGNVAEWTRDWYGSYPEPCNDCTNSVVSPVRVSRGSSWVGGWQNLTVWTRGGPDPLDRDAAGVRCARNP
jgi:formylglycine-generating enzyme